MFVWCSARKWNCISYASIKTCYLKHGPTIAIPCSSSRWSSCKIVEVLGLASCHFRKKNCRYVYTGWGGASSLARDPPHPLWPPALKLFKTINTVFLGAFTHTHMISHEGGNLSILFRFFLSVSKVTFYGLP